MGNAGTGGGADGDRAGDGAPGADAAALWHDAADAATAGLPPPERFFAELTARPDVAALLDALMADDDRPAPARPAPGRDGAPADLAALRARFADLAREPIDVRHTGTDGVREKVRLLATAAMLFDALAPADERGAGRRRLRRGTREVEQAVSVFQHFYGNDPHPSAFEKAAMLLRGVLLDRPFVAGNARTGFLLASYYLALLGHPPPSPLPVRELAALCRDVAAGRDRDVAAITERLRRLWEPSATPG
jgi:prophage maintenance system killer protein